MTDERWITAADVEAVDTKMELWDGELSIGGKNFGHGPLAWALLRLLAATEDASREMAEQSLSSYWDRLPQSRLSRRVSGSHLDDRGLVIGGVEYGDGARARAILTLLDPTLDDARAIDQVLTILRSSS
jgi:hypothetical protein